MITDIHNTDNLHKVYDYLSLTNLISEEEALSFYRSIKSVRSGRPLAPEKERELEKFFSLYNGMTVN